MKIFNDTLKNNGKWSSKKLTTLTCLVFCIFMALVDLFTVYKLNIQVFEAFLLLGGGTSVLTSATNIVNKKLDNDFTNIENNTSTTIKETTIQKG